MTTNTHLSTRIAELEMKISFQEQTIEELNQAIIEQQFIIEKMQLQLRHLANKFNDMRPSNIASMAEETPPPHY